MQCIGLRGPGGKFSTITNWDDDGKTIPNAQPPAPTWLVQPLGIDFFDDVVWVSFVGIELRNHPVANLSPDSDVSPLADLTSLKWLYFFRTPLSDVAPLAGLTKLQELQLSGTQVHDVSPLSDLSKLEKLQLDGTNVRDLTSLSGLSKLEQLQLGDTQVSDVAALSSLANLRVLGLRRTPLTDVTPLGSLTKLKQLKLEHSPVTLKSLRHVKEQLPQCVMDLDSVIDLDL